MSKTQKLILIGAGMAGTRLLEQLIHLQKTMDITDKRYQIEVFNQEPFGGYNRIMLSPVLAGEKSVNEIMTHDECWFGEQGIVLHIGKQISSLDPIQKRLTTFCGETHFYDKLVIATGSNPFMLPIPGADLPGVVSFRDIRDVETMISASKTQQHAVVVGGGLLGLEAAYGLLKRGMKVTVVHRSDILMNMQMDAEAGRLLQKHLANGSDDVPAMHFKMGVNSVEIIGKDKVEGIRFDDGSELNTDLVVMAVGIRPNVELAKAAGLQVNRGILVNDQLQTSDKDVYALGECNEHRGQTYGLVAPLYEQAEVLAKVLMEQQASYLGSLTSTMLKVTGVNLFSAGDFKGETNSDTGKSDKQVVIFRDRAKQIYRKLVIENNRVTGALLFGDVSGANWLFDKLKQQADIRSLRDTLVFGQGYE